MFLAVILGSLVAGVSLGRVFDDTAENANIGRRPKDIIYKNKDGKEDGSFSIIYDSAEESNGYYADEMPSSESEEESDDEEELVFRHDGESIESSIISLSKTGKKNLEAKFVKYDKGGRKKEEKTNFAKRNRKQLEKGKIKKDKTKVDNINIKYKTDTKQVETKLKGKQKELKSKTENILKNKIGKIKARKLKKLAEKKQQESSDSDDEVFDLKSSKTEKKNRKTMSKNVRVKVKQKMEYDDDEEFDEISSAKTEKSGENSGKIKSAKVAHSMEENEEYDDEDEDYEKERDEDTGGPNLESKDDYDYDELKKQLEDAETDARPNKKKHSRDSSYYEKDNVKKGSNKKLETSGTKNKKTGKVVEPKKGPTRKERKRRGRIHKISYGKRVGKSRIKDRGTRFRGKRLFRGRRERRRPKEGMDSYKKTENTRIYNENYRREDPNDRFGRSRQFRDMVAKNRVRDYLEGERIRKAEEEEKRMESRKPKPPDKSMIKKQKMRKISRIKKQRKEIGKLNQQRGTKVDKNKWKVEVNDFN